MMRHISYKVSNIIKVNFRKEKLSIDDDSYLSGVTKIHCRLCGKQRDRNGAIELKETWGYVCITCKEKYTPGHLASQEEGNSNNETDKVYSSKL